MGKEHAEMESLSRVAATVELTRFHVGSTLVLFFASGFAGLVYEVLWMKELGLLFGNTSHAAATTLAAFFLGLVAGARFWGRRAGGLSKPLAAYALLEAGVSLSALVYFLLLDLYHAVYAPLFQALGDQPALFLAVKFLLAMVVLFPPSFIMGGTLPMMSQHLVRSRETLGRMASVLYAVNTLGAAFGAFAAGFVLPRELGFARSYFVAIAVTAAVAVLAWALSSTTAAAESALPEQAGDAEQIVSDLSRDGIRALAFFSGFAALSLEVLWTRMFAQVLQNSVYTFSTILVTFLLALALGAALASWLIRRGREPIFLLFAILTASALLVATTPFVFNWMTNGLEYFGGGSSFGGYIIGSFWCAACVMLIPGILLGTLFPYLLRLAEPFSRDAGRTVGDLAAINTVGAVVGSLVAGFVLLDLFGLWASIRLVAAAYFCAALLVAPKVEINRKLVLALPLGGLLLIVSFLDPSRLPIVKVDPLEKGESVLEVWEGSAGIISVIRQPASIAIKMDNDYSLGGTGASAYEEGQTHLPLLLHPQPDSIFFLGMGTGITAGAALVHPVERVVVSELGADVVEAARTYFEPYVHGLFEDPRASVVAEDGRNYLLGTSERFDVIVADLFMPWKAGVGSLYSLEHYEVARDRLKDGGLYVQWLPLYQISRKELGVVARTMCEVFSLVTLWRGTIAPGWETVALVGHRNAAPLDRDAIERRLAESGNIVLKEQRVASGDAADAEVPPLGFRDVLLQYSGNLMAAERLLRNYPVNTDDRPFIEYNAPVTHRRGRANEASWLVGKELVELLAELWIAVPPENDPYLRELSPMELGHVRAGLSLHVARVLDHAGDGGGAFRAMEEFNRLYATGDATSGAGELEQNRDELQELIQGYEERVRALREHLDELDEGTARTPEQTRQEH